MNAKIGMSAYHDLLNTACRESFLTFMEKAFSIMKPGERFDTSGHHQAIEYVLMEMKEGRRRREMITIPPRSGKSLMISAAWPAWVLGRRPSERFICVSYSDRLAEDLSNVTRTLMESAFYRELFPQTRLERRTLDLLETTQGGGRRATTVGGSVTGFGGHWIIVDDPMKAGDAHSQSAQEAVTNFFDQTLPSRFDNPAEGKLLVVMQRLHQNDLVGHLVERGGYNQLKLQAIATEDAKIQIGEHTFYQVRAGDLLQPARFSQAFLEDTRRSLGSAAFEAQYQQEPTPDGGLVCKRDWVMRYDHPPCRSEGEVIISLDTAVKTNPANDFSAASVWLRVEGRHSLLYVWRDRVEFPDLCHKVRSLIGEYSPVAILIEDAGSGSSLIQQLKREGLPAIACKAKDPKEVRFASVTPHFEAGNVYLPKEAPWLATFEKELFGFPAGQHDDQVDSVSQYLKWAAERAASFFSCDWGYDDPDGGGAPDGDDLLWPRAW